MRRPRFEDLVARALDDLPPDVLAAMDNVEVTIEEEPSREVREEFELEDDETLFGVYRGTPLIDRGYANEPLLPDRIIIYQGPLEDSFDRVEDLVEEIRRTVIHEVAHYIGMDEEEIDDLGYG
ncbi:MAG: metallopeptidase family protein [Gemmatimonadetes bacterium]|nr:metallopeptidase family protein [Gemmatimonadota bacterium]